ncbi:proton-coupled amino acid transporter-like protein acs [Leptinotarsa decemlineata]|uniref:proton-coupled amino acid transporter-like protein acs n=1 Tax=Leptinotarsa decemlineata TaxID=7539 RepID=UPI000C252D37|nr:proton-coupled amino acid transporter-like protein CG1139 [Leptinotarsa decemlineata]
MSEKFNQGDRKESRRRISAVINARDTSTHESQGKSHTVEIKDLKKSVEAGEYDPYNNREVEHPTTSKETFLHLLKGSLGTGILAMPLAFVHSGYILGVVATALIGFLCTYCIYMLVSCEYELCKRRKIPSMNYQMTAEVACEEGPPFFQKVAPYAQDIVNVFLLVYQLGTGTVYTLFIGENIQIVLDDNGIYIDKRWIMSIFLLPLILVNYVKNLKYLAPVSSVANVITLISFGIILYYMIRQDVVWEEREAFGDYKNYPLFFGTVLFALEAIGVIMPLENEMKTPKSFLGPCGVLNSGMSIIVVLYTGMGFYGYLAYGSQVGGSISYTIGNGIPAQVSKVMLALAIFTSHPLQMYPALGTIWTRYVRPFVKNYPHQTIYEYVTKTCVVCFCYNLAVAVPYIDLFISLFGAFSLSALGLAFPAIIYTCTHWYSLRGVKGFLKMTQNIIIIIFAILGLVIGTSTTLKDIIEKISNHNSST